MAGLYILGFFVVALYIISLFVRSSRDNARQRFNNYYKADQGTPSALDSNSVSRIKAQIDRLDEAYSQAEDLISYHMYATDRADLEDRIREIEEERWAKKADRYLQEFLDCYNAIVEGDFENFRDIDELFRTKKRCIDYWQSYFAIDLDEYETIIRPKQYMRDELGDMYDPCMESHESLERRLSSYVERMRPEYKRKQRLYSIILDFVAARSSIPRSDLMKTCFDGYISEEVKSCYRALIKSNKLVEIKLGNRYFVSLSDKESAKRHLHTMVDPAIGNTESDATNPCFLSELNPNKQIGSTNTTSIDKPNLIELLEKNGIRYADKTDVGGCFWIERTDATDALLEGVELDGMRLRMAANSKTLGNVPAYYYQDK